MNVKVTNKNNTKVLRDKHGGIEYVFSPGETLTIPAEAAEHIFGYGLDEKGRWQKFLRSGLANDPKGREIFDRMVIRPVGGNVEATGAVRVA